MNNTLKKLCAFVVIILFVIATIGGTAYLLYFKQTLFGVTNLALAVMALPTLKKAMAELTSIE